MDDFCLPAVVEKFEGVDQLGGQCRIANSVTVFRRGQVPSRGVALGNRVILLDGVRLLVGDLEQVPDANIEIATGTVVNVGSYLSGEGGLYIDEKVLIGPHVRLLSAGHSIDGGSPVVMENPLTFGRIEIGRGAWIGGGATVLQGVSIGQGAVIGAGSVVTKDVPHFAIAIGNPARVVRYRRGFGDT